MSSITFPPRPIRDLNPIGIKTPTETVGLLLALQRTAAASLGVFLFLRYGPALQADMSPFTVGAVAMMAGYCLSAPAAFMGFGALTFYHGGVHINMHLKDKNITCIVISIVSMVCSYVFFDKYKEVQVPLLSTPNFLDKVFNSIADRYCGTIYDQLFSRWV